MNLYSTLTIIVSITAFFAYLNHRFIRLPATIGIMVLSLCCSLLLVIFGHLVPSFSAAIVGMIAGLDFHQLLMNVMLSFLLFAGSVHIHAGRLKKELLPVATLAVFGTLLSTFLVGGSMYFLFQLFQVPIAFIYCLLFGALISPTDPIAVLGILTKARIPQSLEMKISGESLFNDGVGVVIFVTLLEVAQTGLSQLSGVDITLLFVQEAGGGLLYGALLGYLGFWLLKSVNNYQLEVLITLAIVMGGYTLASLLHISGPLAMVVAGIIIGNKGKQEAMTDISRDYIGKFWEMMDEILNAILFLLIGFEMLTVKTNSTLVIIGLIAVLVVLIARWISVALPVVLLRKVVVFERHAITMLTWGGLRGGISVALALSLPAAMYRDEFVSITYCIVVCSIIAQGLTVGKLARALKLGQD